MEYYTVPAERYNPANHHHSNLVTSYSDSFPSHAFQEGVPAYPTLPPYYAQGGSQYISYPNTPSYNQQPGHVFCPPPIAGQNLHLEYPSEETTSVQIHAPVPVSPYTSLLPASGTPDSAAQSTPRISAVPSPSESIPHLHHSTLQEKSPLDQYINAPPATFPTPCDLLNELSARDKVGCAMPPSVPTARPQFGAPAMSCDSGKPKLERKPTDKKPENQRKAYFRAVAENVGFTPTNPDSITSHDKKRHYLECLEQYVLWLHEQLRLVGQEPVSLERFPSYRGLDSRSIRTLLVHMQDETRKLNDQIIREEHRFLELQEQVLALQEGSLDPHSLDARRHSIASGAISAAAVSGTGYQA
ncbi:hypothetical protein NLI96_g8053 [Meripilus lineatus]|uniref:Uncharacterized protein n=1 Tax=Meripilus lineatus TaxID=2056292 RepID=A0AAD5YCD3_9APHY|nr:hypothetical protein NLI96_g8053 [Physisporinus lineatus]